MYAIIECGGKQYKVKEGDIIDVELIAKKTGEQIELGPVLFLDNNGIPEAGSFLQKVKVTGEVINDKRGPKIIIYKYKRRKNYNKKTGHRQDYTRVKITKIAVA